MLVSRGHTWARTICATFKDNRHVIRSEASGRIFTMFSKENHSDQHLSFRTDLGSASRMNRSISMRSSHPGSSASLRGAPWVLARAEANPQLPGMAGGPVARSPVAPPPRLSWFLTLDGRGSGGRGRGHRVEPQASRVARSQTASRPPSPCPAPRGHQREVTQGAWGRPRPSRGAESAGTSRGEPRTALRIRRRSAAGVRLSVPPAPAACGRGRRPRGGLTTRSRVGPRPRCWCR